MKKLGLFIALIAVALGTTGQEVHFSQFWLAPMSFNPALTASGKTDYRATAQYKQQGMVPGITFRTQQAAGEAAFFNTSGRKLGVGALVRQDKSGEAQLRVFEAGGTVALHLRVGQKNTIGTGLGLSYRQRSIALDALSWDAQYNGAGFDPTLPSNEQLPGINSWSIDAQLGGYWEHTGKVTWTAAYSAYHYLQDQGLLGASREPTLMRHNLWGRYTTKASIFLLHADALFSKHGGAMTSTIGARVDYTVGTDSRYTTANTSSVVTAGTYYRWNDAVLFVLGFDYLRTFKATLGYDLTVGGLKKINASRGGWEVGLQWNMPARNQRIKIG
ncbi:MAG: hypothetical protein RL226_871 [Bacteroidota bacterium]|jgi:type IX secretion system PorP/SprF family membrane protein